MIRRRLFGPRIEPDGQVTFRLWAPAARRVELVLDHTSPMHRLDDGWFELTAPDARAGTRYKFRIDGNIEVPDPASSFQPFDVHGASEVIDHTFAWQANDWRGRPWHEAVTLEIHVGTFTASGTFHAAMQRLDQIAESGITAIELMPVADFPGRWNWGYDGVLPFAPDSSYGWPEHLKALIDAAHRRGLMVFLDVVYNHFGPDGNYLTRYAPDFFTKAAATPWGAAVDFSVPQVRSFVIENALHWLDHYRFDGLRLDAVHAIAERGTPSILESLSRTVGAYSAETGRFIHLIVENDDNSASLLDPLADPPRGKYRAQWNDDYHHAWHVLLTGETTGYYRDYAENPRADLARILSSGFAYQGEPSAFRNGAPRGELSGNLPPGAFVSFLQNHDQIGNRPRGERLERLAPPAAVEAALAVTLLAPMPPLLFMGEEWGATEPFPFFCDFTGELADAVRRGRRREFADAYAHRREDGEIPDPLAEETFRSSVLDWTLRDVARHRWRLDLVRRLLEARREHIVPRLANLSDHHNSATRMGDVLVVRWQLAGGALLLTANLSDIPARRPINAVEATPIWGDMSDVLPPWSVYWGFKEE